MAITLFLTPQTHHRPYVAQPHHHRRLSTKPHRTNLFIAHSSPSPLQSFPRSQFQTPKDLENLELLEAYTYHHQLPSGLLLVRAMKDEETEMTAALLAESFAESMAMAGSYVKLLEFLVKNYLMERKESVPNCATLLGIYRENDEEDFELAGTVELSFNDRGANVNPPTPRPPANSPYICNMAVTKPLRRRGIGWHLLKAGEGLITQMSSAREVYLHCRIIDEGPLSMYRKAGYGIVKTDSFLTLLTLQRRRHLMRKDLPSVGDDSSIEDTLGGELS